MNGAPDPDVSPPLAPREDELHRFRELVEAHSGVVVDERQNDALVAAVSGVARQLGLHSTAAVLAACQEAAGRVMASLVRQLTVKETHFFRNAPQFRALRDVVIPELLERNASTRELCAWSAGCSTGEETYSLAMTICDALADREQDPDTWSITVLGTDLDSEALGEARRGVYGSYSFRGVTAEDIERHFERDGKRYRVPRRYRELVKLQELNLKRDRFPDVAGPFHDLDLILCRNVTIYFSEETTRALADRFHECLADGGYLVVGHAENSLETYRRFETHAFPDAIFYRRGGASARAVAEVPWTGVLSLGLPPLADTPVRPPPRRPEREDAGRAGARRRAASAASAPRRPGLEDAREALGAGDVDRAVTLVVEALEHDHEDADLCLFLGELAADRGHAAEATAWLERTLELRPLDLTAHYVLALLTAERGQHEEAMEHLRRAIYIDADFVMGHYLAARLQREAGRAEATERNLRTLRSILETMRQDEEVPLSDGLTAAELLALLDRRAG